MASVSLSETRRSASRRSVPIECSTIHPATGQPYSWPQDSLLDVPLAKIYGVITFYNFFKTEKTGRNVIQVCMGTACYLRGGEDILLELEKQLGVGVNATTADGEFTIEAVRCLGCCGLAPVAVVNGVVHGKLVKTKVEELISQCCGTKA